MEIGPIRNQNLIFWPLADEGSTKYHTNTTKAILTHDPPGFNLISSPTNVITMTAAHARITANLQLLIAQAKQIAEQNQEMAATTTEELAENIEPPWDKVGGAIWQ